MTLIEKMFFKERGKRLLTFEGKNSPSRQASWNVSKKRGFPPQSGITWGLGAKPTNWINVKPRALTL